MSASRVVCWSAVLLMPGVQSSDACWRALDADAFASNCPIVVSGTIARIDIYSGAAERNHDIAYIAIHKILKNDLKDEPLFIGGHVKAKMCSSKNRVRVSTDIRYELGTGGIWLITMAPDGSFHIDQHPVQRQPQDKPFRMRELFSVGKDGNIIGRYTRTEWLQRKGSADKRSASAADNKDEPENQ